MLRETSTVAAPWYVVDGADPQYRELTIGKLVLAALQRAAPLPASKPRGLGACAKRVPSPRNRRRTGALRSIDLAHTLSAGEYDEALPMWQHRLARHTRRKRFGKHSLILVFEGADAAGKGGAIRRVTGALDARQYVNVPIAAPDDEERRYPWLWRFWRHVPPQGGITIFDRSWYGRVLVERVEGFCSVADWQRAYGEINQFRGAAVRRQRDRLQVLAAGQQGGAARSASTRASKRRSSTSRSRRTTGAIASAGTTTSRRSARWSNARRRSRAPWTVIGADDKRYARVEVLRTIVERLDQALG